MLTIRLHRVGKTNQPSFKIIVVDKRKSAASGKFREDVGSIDRVTKQVKLKKDKIAYWLSKGAKPSGTVHNILVSENLLMGKKIAVHAKRKKPKEKGAAPEKKEAQAEQAKNPVPSDGTNGQAPETAAEAPKD
jgi:small subunit ribosomal protein S16